MRVLIVVMMMVVVVMMVVIMVVMMVMMMMMVVMEKVATCCFVVLAALWAALQISRSPSLWPLLPSLDFQGFLKMFKELQGWTTPPGLLSQFDVGA